MKTMVVVVVVVCGYEGKELMARSVRVLPTSYTAAAATTTVDEDDNMGNGVSAVPLAESLSCLCDEAQVAALKGPLLGAWLLQVDSLCSSSSADWLRNSSDEHKRRPFHFSPRLSSRSTTTLYMYMYA